MNKGIILFFALICAISAYGQNKKVDKNVDRAIEANQSVIDDLIDNVSSLNYKFNTMDTLIQKFSQRRFPRLISNEKLEKELCQLTIKGIWENKNDIQKKLKLAEDSVLAKNYFKIIEIYKSLNEVYNEEKNSEYIQLLEDVKLLECHNEEYERISSSVKDYRFVMFELARVIKIIDGLINKGLGANADKKLNESDELVFINEIPYASSCIEQYISSVKNNGGKQERDDLLKELKKACPEAFSDFK